MRPGLFMALREVTPELPGKTFSENYLTSAQYSGLNEMAPDTHMFEYLLPSW